MAPKRKSRKSTSAQTVFQHVPLIKAFTKAKNARSRKQILDISPGTIKSLDSILKNILGGNVPLKTKQRKILEKNLSNFKRISKCGVHKKKEIFVNQKGGAIPLLSLIPAALSLVSGLFNN